MITREVISMETVADVQLGTLAPDEQMKMSDGAIISVANASDLPAPAPGNVWVILLANSQVTQRSAGSSGTKVKLRCIPA